MAKNQHYLPRFLLKGFASRKKKQNAYAWVYSQAGEVFEANTFRICAEKFFYGEEGAGSLDDEITEFEHTYAQLLDELRAKTGITKIEDKSIAEFITHLITRSRHIRDSVREPAEYFLEKLKEQFIEKLSPLPYPIKHQLTEKFIKLCTEAIQKSPEMTKHGQLKALSEDLIPEKRTRKYKELNWYSCETKENLLLGDVGCVIETIGKKRFISIDMRSDILRNIYLPISSNHVIVGTNQDTEPSADVGLLNSETVKLSRTIFIASQNNPEFNELLPLIGKNSGLITKEKLEEIVAKKL